VTCILQTKELVTFPQEKTEILLQGGRTPCASALLRLLCRTSLFGNIKNKIFSMTDCDDDVPSPSLPGPSKNVTTSRKRSGVNIKLFTRNSKFQKPADLESLGKTVRDKTAPQELRKDADKILKNFKELDNKQCKKLDDLRVKINAFNPPGPDLKPYDAAYRRALKGYEYAPLDTKLMDLLDMRNPDEYVDESVKLMRAGYARLRDLRPEIPADKLARICRCPALLMGAEDSRKSAEEIAAMSDNELHDFEMYCPATPSDYSFADEDDSDVDKEEEEEEEVTTRPDDLNSEDEVDGIEEVELTEEEAMLDRATDALDQRLLIKQFVDLDNKTGRNKKWTAEEEDIVRSAVEHACVEWWEVVGSGKHTKLYDTALQALKGRGFQRTEKQVRGKLQHMANAIKKSKQ